MGLDPRTLDSDNFATRQKATSELKKLGAAAAGRLSKVIQGQPSPELAGRVQSLLATLKQQPLEAEALRTLRAVELLERIGSAEARQMLEGLAQRSLGLQPSEHARAALERLDKQASSLR